MPNVAIARWFIESVGLGSASRVDPWELARRWGFVVRLRSGGTAELPRSSETIWLDPAASDGERRESLAYELAAAAVEISGRGDAEAVASLLLGRRPAARQALPVRSASRPETPRSRTRT